MLSDFPKPDFSLSVLYFADRMRQKAEENGSVRGQAAPLINPWIGLLSPHRWSRHRIRRVDATPEKLLEEFTDLVIRRRLSADSRSSCARESNAESDSVPQE